MDGPNVSTSPHNAGGDDGSSSIDQAMLARLQQVFERLRAGQVPFCILRNRDRIPRALSSGSDVDLIVPAGTSIPRLCALLADLLPVHVVPHRATLEVYLPVGDLCLHVDLLVQDRQWRGATYLTNAEILAGARDDDGMPVASLVHQAFCAWFSNLTRRRQFKPRYVPLIVRAVQEDRATMARLLDRAFGRRLGRELLALVDQNMLGRSNDYARRCRRAIWTRAIVRRPIATLRGLVGYYVPELKLWARPTGLAVAVLGPDGAGKSAVCTALADASRAELPFVGVEIQHMYERALPRLSELKRGKVRRLPSAPVVTHDPHGKRPHSFIASIVSLGYATLDQWVSRLWWGRGKLGKNMLLLHDRYMLELTVDPRRFRFGGPDWFARLVARLTPALDMVILLDAPAEVLQARKQEVTFAETERQRQAYRTLVRGLPHGHVIDVTRPLDQVVRDAKATIRQTLANRARARFGLWPGERESGASSTSATISPSDLVEELSGKAIPQ